MAPFQVYGNLFFVGTQPASAHIIDTGSGLILLDAGYQQTLPYVIDSIYRLGFRLEDLRLILLSHGHIDHIGGARMLRDMTGAEIAIGKQDEEYASGKRDLTYASELGMVYDTPFEPDVLLSDLDEIRIGDTCIRCFHTPGHTEGTMSYLFNVSGGERELVAGTHGGIGINTMSREFLEAYGLPLSLRDAFFEGLDRMEKLHVDIFIPNHQDQWNTLERYRRLIGGEREAFVDVSAWNGYLRMARDRLNCLIEGETNAV